MSNPATGLTAYYSRSRALVIGINDYEYTNKLSYAISDAKEIANLLMEEFAFPSQDVRILLDRDATRESILREFHKLTKSRADQDERILFFFAGHGHTVQGHRGEVGFLVPADGRCESLDTLIRWDELTRNADLIPAKHIFFVMDACYGGLALTRGAPPGAKRFLTNMLARHSRQVLTAGKADEVVADSGGPLPGHSVFTGHLIEGLRGNAAQRDGIVTAQGVMAYVYERVSRDHHSRQTPHYGHIDGDGDFIFAAPPLEDRTETEEKEGKDLLIMVPPAGNIKGKEDESNKIRDAKELLSEPRHRIALHDLVVQELREVLGQTADDAFAVQGHAYSQGEFSTRLRRYEELSANLRQMAAAVAYWGEDVNRDALAVIFSRLAGRFESRNGLVVWLALRWYPLILTLYSAGIAALAARKYASLATIFLSNVGDPDSSQGRVPLVHAIGKALLELNRADGFKDLPGHERQFVPRSEYLFKLLQPELDDLLFLGQDYEECFDRFEIFLALGHSHFLKAETDHFWAPIGRFGWKARRGRGQDTFRRVLGEAEAKGDGCDPIREGLFPAPFERFQEISQQLNEAVSRIEWV